METLKKSLYELHREHKEWINRLKFYKDDIAFLEDRVNEIGGKYTDKEVLVQVDHLLNQLNIQRHHARRLKDEVKHAEGLIERNIIHNPVAVDHRKVDDNIALRESIEQFEVLFQELRTELIDFFTKWM